MYVKSYFTLIEEVDGAIIVHNSLTGILLKFEGEIGRQIKFLLSSKNINKDENNANLIELLLKKQIIISDKVNEKELVNEFETNAMNNDGVLKLIIMPTEQCNFRCKYCYEKFEKGKMNKDIQNRIILFVNENIHRFRAINVEWFGGEPLLAQDVIEYLSKKILEICRKNNKPYLAQMTTNGYLLTADLAKKMYKYHINEFQITLDGLKKTHDKQRCLINEKETFDTIINNLLDIRDNINDLHITILLRTNITYPIYEKMEEFIDYLAYRFSNNYKFVLEWRFAADMGGERVKAIEKDFIKDKNYEKLLLKYQYIALQKGLKFTNGISIIKPAGMVCYACKKFSFIIGSDGLLYKCTDAFYDPIGVVGEIMEDGSLQIDIEKENYWCGFKRSSQIEKCLECKVRPICLAADCPNRRYKNNGQIVCPAIKDNIREYIRFFACDPLLCKTIVNIGDEYER